MRIAVPQESWYLASAQSLSNRSARHPEGGTLPDAGIANIALLKGGGDGPNAVVTHVTATFWLETLQGDPEPRQLQYSQVVLLEFLDLLWPHVTVATLRKKLPAPHS